MVTGGGGGGGYITIKHGVSTLEGRDVIGLIGVSSDVPLASGRGELLASEGKGQTPDGGGRWGIGAWPMHCGGVGLQLDGAVSLTCLRNSYTWGTRAQRYRDGQSGIVEGTGAYGGDAKVPLFRERTLTNLNLLPRFSGVSDRNRPIQEGTRGLSSFVN